MGLSVITSGSQHTNPSELLASENMIRFLEQLKQEKRVSIIDCPPFLMSDAAQIATKVDDVILVVQPGKTTMHSLTAVLEQLERVQAHVIGIIFNRISRNRSDYYGGYERYSKYYYSKDSKEYFDIKNNGNGRKHAQEEAEKLPQKEPKDTH